MIHPLTPPEVTPQVIAVKVPHGSTGIFASYNDIETVLYFDQGEVKLFDYCQQVEYIGLYSQATEEMAKRIVDVKANLYTDYLNEKVVCVTAKESLTSLMNSKKLFLVNPYGEKRQMDYCKGDDEDWQEAEKNLSDYVFLINK